MPADIIFFAVLAIVILLWFNNVVGTKSGSDRQRPNPYDPKNHKTKKSKKITEQDNNVSKKSAPAKSRSALKPVIRSDHIDNKTAETALGKIARSDKSFDTEIFISNARAAFTIVVKAFADADRSTLKTLLSVPVYDAFESTIDQREAAGESVQTIIHAIEKSSIIEAAMRGSTAYITVRFTAAETCVIRDKDGNITSGKPGKKTKFTDVWVFARDTKSKDPRWLLVETRDDEDDEDGKTPLPEAK